MSKPMKRDRLNALVSNLSLLVRQRAELESKHEEVFDRHRELSDEIATVTEAVKTEARKLADATMPSGESKMLVDSEQLSVTVVRKNVPTVYDYDMATKVLAPAALDAVRPKVIDPKLLLLAIDDGSITVKATKKFSRPGDPPTTAVTVKVLG